MYRTAPLPSASSTTGRSLHLLSRISAFQQNGRGRIRTPIRLSAIQQRHEAEALSTFPNHPPPGHESESAAPAEAAAPKAEKRQTAVESPYHEIDAAAYDLDVRHYQVPVLRFFSPSMVIASGLVFLVAANLLAEGGPSLQTTALAAVPVGLWYFIFLQVLPSVFKDFAVQYMETHEFVMSTTMDEDTQPAAAQAAAESKPGWDGADT